MKALSAASLPGWGGGQVQILCSLQPRAGSQSSPIAQAQRWKCVLGLLRSTWQCPLWESGLLRHPSSTGPCSAGWELQWQQVPPDGEPPATALEGTIWLMVSLVMAVRAGE